MGDARMYAAQADDDVAMMIPGETRHVVANLEEILSVEGVDAVMIGSTDLASPIGCNDNRHAPGATETVQSKLNYPRQRGVPFGMFTQTVDEAAYWMARRSQAKTCASDATFIKVVMAGLSAPRRLIGHDVEALGD